MLLPFPKAKKSRKTVADLATWQLCFNHYMAALCTIYLGMLPQMLAYANIIIQVQLQFLGGGWLTYDQMFRTACCHQMQHRMENVDASLYARFVSRQPRRSGVCQVCCSSARKSTACPWGGGRGSPARTTTSHTQHRGSPSGSVLMPAIPPPPANYLHILEHRQLLLSWEL